MMKHLLTSLLLITALPAFAGTDQLSPVEQVEFCRLAEPIAHRAAGRDVDALLRTYLETRQIVYVEGFMAEKNRAFYDNLVALRELDAQLPVTRIFPKPEFAIETNVAMILAELKLAAQKNPGRAIVLIGMSKGAAEVVQLAATHPEIFVNDNGFVVDVVLPLNAAIGGSVLADLELGDADLESRYEKYKVDTNQEDSWFERLIGGWLKRAYLNSDTPGFKSLSTPVSRARNAALLAELSQEKSALLGEKVRFVTTHRTGKNALDIPSYLGKLAGFLGYEGRANDGLLYEVDQLLPGVGQHLLSIDGASHFNLTGTYGEAACRKEFTRYLLLLQAAR